MRVFFLILKQEKQPKRNIDNMHGRQIFKIIFKNKTLSFLWLRTRYNVNYRSTRPELNIAAWMSANASVFCHCPGTNAGIKYCFSRPQSSQYEHSNRRCWHKYLALLINSLNLSSINTNYILQQFLNEDL